MNPSAIRDISQRTQVFENDLKVVPLFWRNDPVERIYRGTDGKPLCLEPSKNDCDNQIDNVIGYFMRSTSVQKYLSANELPVEFFNHELMAVDTDSEQSLFEFVTKWGFPYSYVRNGEMQREDRESLTKLKIERLSQESHNMTLRLEIWLLESMCDPGFSVISIDEARISIVILQTVVEQIWWHFKYGTSVYLGPINRTTRHSIVVDPKEGLPDYLRKEITSYGFLTSAICNQIMDTIAEETPWRACACEGCEVVFKRKQSGVLSPYSESVYCCKRCEERQKKRNQRAAAKNRIRH